MHTKSLSDSIQFLSGVGPKRADSFNSIGIKTIENLLFYFPSKYLDRSNIISSIKILEYLMNGFEGEVTVVAKVEDTEMINYGRKQIFKVRFQDSSGSFECVWFKGIKYFKTLFQSNDVYALSGKPVLTRYGNLQFTHPDFDKFSQDESIDFTNTGKIIPFYSIPQELKSQNIGDIGLRKIIKLAVDDYGHLVTETLPKSIISSNNFLDIVTAVKNIHFPTNDDLLLKAKERFKYEELFYIATLVALRKFNFLTRAKGISFNIEKDVIKQFLKSLPFELTIDQLKVLSEIKHDMLSKKPMNRLLQGDVGSGKTIVAIISILICISNGYQAVIMAPTEILANQHYNTVKTLFEGMDIEVHLLTGSTKAAARKQIHEDLQSSKCKLIIGTHALIEDTVIFKNLGLVVIDEQHRFGVAQRAKMWQKSTRKAPHILVMTATPIPRTMAMTLYGDLDVSVIDELPPGRKSIKTYHYYESARIRLFAFMKEQIKKGRQIYVVYPLIFESEKMDLNDLMDGYESISRSFPLPEYAVSILHGKMKTDAKEWEMKRFIKGETDILVSTTVIEVGVDVSNATVMVIENAERFGLSQLHQLRGRVGRGAEQSYCILITKDKISVEAKKRISTMTATNDGFEIAEVDLSIRGPGDLQGTQQSGILELKIANILEDEKMLKAARKTAFDLVEKDAVLETASNSRIKNKLQDLKKDSFNWSLIS